MCIHSCWPDALLAIRWNPYRAGGARGALDTRHCGLGGQLTLGEVETLQGHLMLDTSRPLSLSPGSFCHPRSPLLTHLSSWPATLAPDPNFSCPVHVTRALCSPEKTTLLLVAEQQVVPTPRVP